MPITPMQLDYTIVYSDRRTIGLCVERDRSVVVRAPHGTGSERIAQVIEQKKFWLYQKVNHRDKYPAIAPTKEMVSGESLLYLGQHYRLEIVPPDAPPIEWDRGFRIARAPREEARARLRAWYEERAREHITDRVAYFAARMGVTCNEVQIADMRLRWASCTPKDNLRFNWRVIKAPTDVIDYLVVHELAHLREPNHTKRFWNIVAVQTPHYEEAKHWLRQNGTLLETDL